MSTANDHHQQRPAVTIRRIPASATHALRHAVLWPHKPPSYVQLPEDEAGLHFGAFVCASPSSPPSASPSASASSEANPEDLELVSIISLFITSSTTSSSSDSSREEEAHAPQRVARFRKFATAPAWQGRGVGTALLRHVIAAAAQAGARRIWCDAREAALPFYERFGLRAEGEVFFKGDVPYLRMTMALGEGAEGGGAETLS